MVNLLHFQSIGSYKNMQSHIYHWGPCTTSYSHITKPPRTFISTEATSSSGQGTGDRWRVTHDRRQTFSGQYYLNATLLRLWCLYTPEVTGHPSGGRDKERSVIPLFHSLSWKQDVISNRHNYLPFKYVVKKTDNVSSHELESCLVNRPGVAGDVL